MISADDFVSGANINYRALFQAIGGGAILAYFSGLADVILSLADIPIRILGVIADFLGAVVSVVVGLPAVIIADGFQAAIPFISDAGIAGFAVGLSIALATFYAVERGLSYVG
jgi:hypothetical protein